MTDNNVVNQNGTNEPNAVTEPNGAQNTQAVATEPTIDQKGLINGIVDGIKGVFAKDDSSKKTNEPSNEPVNESKVLQMTQEEFEAAVVAKSKEVASESITNALGTEKLHREVGEAVEPKYKDFVIGQLKDSKNVKEDLAKVLESYPEFKKAEKVTGTSAVTGKGTGVEMSASAAAIVNKIRGN